MSYFNPSTLQEDLTLGGVSLSTMGWNVSTLGGQEGFPARVGDNIIIPYRTGRIWKPKTYDQRILTYAMWISGRDPTTNEWDPPAMPATTPRQQMRAQFNDNYDLLKALISRVDAQVTMTKKRLYTTEVMTFTANGEVASGSAASGTNSQEFGLQPITPWYGTVTLDVVMADPWWYTTPQVNVPLSVGSNTIDYAGTAPLDGGGPSTAGGNFTLESTGAFTTFELTNTSVTPNVSVELSGYTAVSGETVTIDFQESTVTSSVNGNITGYLLHTGALVWMYMVPGNNVLTLSGGGTVSLNYYPAYV